MSAVTLRRAAAVVLFALAPAPSEAQTGVEMVRRAAEQGDALAQYFLGIAYVNGEGVPENDAEAARWFRRAAEQGNALAQGSLGIAYADGLGVLKDAVLAHIWLNIASANGQSAVAGEVRDALEREMTPAQIERATELARRCMASDYEGCER